MAQYFFKMSQSERNNILDQHKTIYDGYVTQYGQQSNTQPLYVQDFANDKVGLTVSNKGVVKPYTNMGINESHTGLDMIGGDEHDQSEMKYRHLENGTVDIDSIMNMLDPEGFESQPMNFDKELEEDDLPNFIEKLNESLDMFKRFKKYN